MTVLAHHPLVEALPAVVPMVNIVLAFAGIVVSDRRRARMDAESGQRAD